MNRRGFLFGITSAGLLAAVPERVRAYSFLPGLAHAHLAGIRAELEADGFPGWFDLYRYFDGWRLDTHADIRGVPHCASLALQDRSRFQIPKFISAENLRWGWQLADVRIGP